MCVCVIYEYTFYTCFIFIALLCTLSDMATSPLNRYSYCNYKKHCDSCYYSMHLHQQIPRDILRLEKNTTHPWTDKLCDTVLIMVLALRLSDYRAFKRVANYFDNDTKMYSEQVKLLTKAMLYAMRIYVEVQNYSRKPSYLPIINRNGLCVLLQQSFAKLKNRITNPRMDLNKLRDRGYDIVMDIFDNPHKGKTAFETIKSKLRCLSDLLVIQYFCDLKYTTLADFDLEYFKNPNKIYFPSIDDFQKKAERIPMNLNGLGQYISMFEDKHKQATEENNMTLVESLNEAKYRCSVYLKMYNYDNLTSEFEFKKLHNTVCFLLTIDKPFNLNE